jgi:hypothetical protein
MWVRLSGAHVRVERSECSRTHSCVYFTGLNVTRVVYFAVVPTADACTTFYINFIHVFYKQEHQLYPAKSVCVMIIYCLTNWNE